MGRRPSQPLERDLQQHLEDLSRQVNNVPGKISTIVEESVKYLQNVYSREAQDEKNKMETVRKTMTLIEENIKVHDIMEGDVKKDIMAMETSLADCAATAKAVITRGITNKDRLTGLLQELKRESFISNRIKQESASLARNLGSNREVDVMSKTMVMAELHNTILGLYFENQAFTSPSPTRQVSIKPLPSIRRLPTLPLQVGTAPQQPGIMGTVGMCNRRVVRESMWNKSVVGCRS